MSVTKPRRVGRGRGGERDWGVSCAEDCRLLLWDLERGVLLRDIRLGRVLTRAACEITRDMRF